MWSTRLLAQNPPRTFTLNSPLKLCSESQTQAENPFPVRTQNKIMTETVLYVKKESRPDKDYIKLYI